MMMATDSILRWGKLEFDCNSYEVAWEGKSIDLTPIELYILKYFMGNPQVLITAEDIIENVKNKNLEPVWPTEDDWPSNHTVRTHVNNLKKKFRALDAPEPVERRRGMGYRLSQHL